jgi:hypothetical protein
MIGRKEGEEGEEGKEVTKEGRNEGRRRRW